MGARSRRKGAAFEREVAAFFRLLGYPGARRRLAQYQESDGRDLEGTPGLAVQAKCGKRPDPWAAMAEAAGSAKGGEMPVVVARRDGQGALLCFRLEDAGRIALALGGTLKTPFATNQGRA